MPPFRGAQRPVAWNEVVTMFLPLCWMVLLLPLVTPQSHGLAMTEVRKGCGLEEGAAIGPAPVALEDGNSEKPGPQMGDTEIVFRPENGGERAEEPALQQLPGGRGMYGGFLTGGPYGGVNGVSASRWFGARRPRQSDTATLFDSLDENADGVLAEDEIREFVEEVGGSTLDDHSEISGGVSTVMGRLDTDSEEGIGLKELSSRIKSFESILTVEEAVDWVTHAVQLPEEVAQAFRSNSVSGYDLLEFLDYDGRGLHYDLGIKKSYRKRIVQAIEIRLLGLGEEPLPPKLHQPSYLGGGKAHITWSPVDESAVPGANDHSGAADGQENAANCEDRASVDEAAQASETACISGTTVATNAGDSADTPRSAQEDRGGTDSFHTFPVHKYVLQKTCLGCQVTGSASAVGKGQSSGFGESSSSDGSWVTVHEENVVDFPYSSMAFVDSDLAHGEIYAYRLRAWNRVGHSEASFVRLTTPPAPHLWKKRWRIVAPWLPIVNNSTPGADTGADNPDSIGVDTQGIIDEAWAWAMEGMRAAWFVLSWSWWLLRHSLSAVNAFVVLAGISANLMRLAAAYGDGGTGSRSRRNWPAVLLLKLTDLITRNRFVCSLAEEINVRLERLLASPSAPPSRRIYRQDSMRAIAGGSSGSSQRSRNVSEDSVRSDWSPRSESERRDPREDWTMLSRIEEEYAGVGVDFGWTLRGAYRTRRWSSSSTEYPADNHATDLSRYRSVSPSFTTKTDLSPTGQHLRWPRRSGARTPQRRSSDRGEAHSPPGFFGQGGDWPGGGGISMVRRHDVVPERLASSEGTTAESPLTQPQPPIPAPGSVEHSEEHAEERCAGVSRRRFFFRRGSSSSSSTRVSMKEADRSARELPEGERVVKGRGVRDGEEGCDDRVGNDLGEAPIPPSLLRSGSSEYRLTMHLRKSSVSRLALGLRKGEVSGRDAWLKEFQEAQACFICHRRFHSLTMPRHHCSRCHRAFCSRDGHTPHPPLTRCSIPGDCICDACIQSETSGCRRGTVSDDGEGLGMRTFETGAQGTADPTAASNGVSTPNGRRLIWRSSARLPSFGRLSRRWVSVGPTRNVQASTGSADTLSSLAVSSVAASAGATSSVRDSSTGTASPSEGSPATCPPPAPQRVSIDEARVGVGSGIVGDGGSGMRRRVTR